LDQCGLDTGYSDARLDDDRARAGLEHNLLTDDAPYVVKDPWLFVYCDRVDPGAVAVDALLVPVRELMASATSRILQERIAMAEGPWADWPSSDVNGVVMGGAVYSLDPVDEARILAVGFHRLIHWATTQQIPLFLLEFPRIVIDADYLIESLWPWLGDHCDRERAFAAFARVADPLLVRVDNPGHRIQSLSSPDTVRLDREAMAIRLKESEARLASANDQLAETSEALGIANASLAESTRDLSRTQDDLAGVRGLLAESEAALVASRARIEVVTTEIEKMRGTLSWRITRPLRRAKSLLRNPG
jgi:hypothetical protein